MSRLYDALSEWKDRPVSARKMVLIGRDGLVRWRDDGYRVGDEEDWKALLAAIATL